MTKKEIQENLEEVQEAFTTIIYDETGEECDVYFWDRLKENIKKLIRPFSSYVVIDIEGTWDKRNGYCFMNTFDTGKLFDNYSTFNDVTIHGKRKAAEFSLSGHDTPMGHPRWVVGITQKEKREWNKINNYEDAWAFLRRVAGVEEF